MNKLEEYRDKKARETSYYSVFKVGFDAAIALNLAVKYNRWVLDEASTSLDTINSRWVVSKVVDGKVIEGDEALYKYWIDNIYKP